MAQGLANAKKKGRAQWKRRAESLRASNQSLQPQKKNEFFNAKYPQNQSMQMNEEQRVI
jgi:hypothetical protein